MKLLSKLSTYYALGVSNVWRVLVYRIKLRTGFHSVLKISAPVLKGPFFRPPLIRGDKRLTARHSWAQRSLLFGKHEFSLGDFPDWHANPFKAGARADDVKHWSAVADFDPSLGDIKTVWESSRFDWLIANAQRAALGDMVAYRRLEAWLADWNAKNAPYIGANWKCGQEASIRVLSLALAALLMGQTKTPLPDLIALIKLHLARIAPTIDYAIGQANNHGTSEAAALFIGGSWLEKIGDSDGAALTRLGRQWLEDRAQVLIEADGTFSQYSIIYHRLMLDTYNLCEIWRRHLVLPAFSEPLIDRLKAATLWLHQLTNSETGYAPNLGANDGARILSLVDCDYRDCRPSLQLAAALFCKARAISAVGYWDQPLYWHDINSAVPLLEAPSSQSLDDGGLHVLRAGRSVCYMRYPRFRFRPSQADALHVDVWHGGKNLLRDAGTYSYNSSDGDQRYFKGTSAHNTVEIDGRDQMPSLSRFLFGNWPKAQDVELVSKRQSDVYAAAGYVDSWGAKHRREVKLSDHRLICIDKVNGVGDVAVLRWRLAQSNWVVSDGKISDGVITIHVSCSGEPFDLVLGQGMESSYYLEKTNVDVLEIKVKMPAVITSMIEF